MTFAGQHEPRAGRRWAKWLFALVAVAVGNAAVPFTSTFLVSIEERFGTAARGRLEAWESLVDTMHDVDEGEKLQRANGFMNRVPFVSDDEHWGRRDYWATPVEFLSTNGGDCEDYSIAKYATLRSTDVIDARLRIVYVRALTQRQAHMVLAYYPRPDAEPLILDNLDKQIRLASERSDLIPVYSFNGEGLWRSVGRDGGRRVGNAATLSVWRGVLERIEAEHAAGGMIADAERRERPWMKKSSDVVASERDPGAARENSR